MAGKSSSSFTLKIEGLSQAAELPGFLDRGQRELLDRIVDKLAGAIGDASGSTRIRAGARGHSISSTKGIVGIYGVVFAKARDRGAYITPKGGKVLRFADGSFRTVARLKPHNYVRKGMRKRRAIAAEAFAASFGDLRKGT